jgi:hypothetical protein
MELRAQLYRQPARSSWAAFLQPGWRGGVLAGVALGLVLGVGATLMLSGGDRMLATANSQAPGVYATSFYSKSAKAQVVWLNGMEPASDKPTYLEATGAVRQPPSDSGVAGDPNSL